MFADIPAKHYGRGKLSVVLYDSRKHHEFMADKRFCIVYLSKKF